MGTVTTEPSTRHTNQTAARPGDSPAKAVARASSLPEGARAYSRPSQSPNTATPMMTADQDHPHVNRVYEPRRHHNVAPTASRRTGYSQSNPSLNAPVISVVASSAISGSR